MACRSASQFAEGVPPKAEGDRSCLAFSFSGGVWGSLFDMFVYAAQCDWIFKNWTCGPANIGNNGNQIGLGGTKKKQHVSKHLQIVEHMGLYTCDLLFFYPLLYNPHALLHVVKLRLPGVDASIFGLSGGMFWIGFLLFSGMICWCVFVFVLWNTSNTNKEPIKKTSTSLEVVWCFAWQLFLTKKRDEHANMLGLGIGAVKGLASACKWAEESWEFWTTISNFGVW